MTDNVKRFLETNYLLLDTDMNEFFHTAYNGLTINEQRELIEVLDYAGVDYENARNTVLRFILTMTFETLCRPVYLDTFVNRHLYNILGFDYDCLREYILEEAQEFDIDIVVENNDYKIYPRV